MKNWKKEILSIPNLQSLFRLVLITEYILIYLNAEQTTDYVVAASILAVSCLTDLIDGKIARHFNMITTLGKLLDPVADKATQFTLTVCLAIKHPVLWNLAGLFVLKEGFQFVAGLITYRKGKMLTGALISGKICTTILFITLILLVLLPDLNPKIVDIITITDAVFMLISFAHYALTYYRKTPMIQDLETKS